MIHKLFGGITLPGQPDLNNVRRLDLLPTPQIRRMMTVGAAIDPVWLENVDCLLESRQEQLLGDIKQHIPVSAAHMFAGTKDLNALDDDDSVDTPNSIDSLVLNVNSSEQVGKLLFEVLDIGQGDRLKTTKSGKAISTGKKQLETLKRRHPVVPLMLEYRETAKLRNTYTQKLASYARKDADGFWRIHGDIVTTRADTGRLAMRRPNCQNIPARSAWGREVRKAFIAGSGRVLISQDFSQIELRLLAHCAHEQNMINIFLDPKGDIHLDTAMRAFGLPKDRVDKLLHRAPCKNVNFGVCLSADQLVLTDIGRVKIQDVTRSMRLWDGKNWVTHDGVIYKGYKRVIRYDGISATPDHKVWLRDGRLVPIAEAMAQGWRIAATADKDLPLRYDPGARDGEGSSETSLHSVQSGLVLSGDEPVVRPTTAMPMPQAHVSRSQRGSRTANGPVLLHRAALHKPRQRVVSKLRQARNSVQVPFLQGVHQLYIGTLTTRGLQKSGHRPNKQRWTLRVWKFSLRSPRNQFAQYPTQRVDGLQGETPYCDGPAQGDESGLPAIRSIRGPYQNTGEKRLDVAGNLAGSTAPEEGHKEHEQQSEQWAHVYDILNVGPDHRFTCEGKLVSNCYGLGGGGLFDLMALTYATAGIPLPDFIDLEWCEAFIKTWFNLYPNVRQYMDKLYWCAKHYGIIWDLMGRIRQVPEVYSSFDHIVAAGLRQAGNMPIQGLAAGVFKIAMAKLERRFAALRADGIWVNAILPVHDELIVEVDRKYAEEVQGIMTLEMNASMNYLGSNECALRVPVLSDGKIMDRWIKD